MNDRLPDSERWIWPFELLDKLGEGGMSVVYRARYVGNDRIVAVKLLPKDTSGQANMTARFQREMEVLKTLKHPNIVYCFGGVCEDQRPFYAMELIEGGTLEELLNKRGKFSWEQTIEYALQMCSALEYAHSQGIIHRDVKPGNFLITKNGKLKLADFGLATMATARKITAAGKTMGTWHYMAPEQIRGKNLGPQTDLYALGCVLYELLTGMTAYAADVPAQILHQHLKAPIPRVTQFAPDCPPELERIICDLMQKEPEKRPASAAEVARRLEQVTPTITVTPRNANSRAITKPTDIPAESGLMDEMKLPKVNIPGLTNWQFIVIALLLLWVTWLYQRIDRYAANDAALIQVYQSSKFSEKIHALTVLEKMQHASPEVVETLIAGLADNNVNIRVATIRTLGEMGADAKPAIPKLIALSTKDSDAKARREAVIALEKIRAAHTMGRYWLILVAIFLTLCFVIWSQREKIKQTFTP